MHPAYRLRGIGTVLSEVQIRENDVTMGLGITDSAYRAYLRSGWVDLGMLPSFVRPLDVGAMLARRWPGWAGRLAGAMLDPTLRLAETLSELSGLLNDVRMERIRRFDARADDLWHSVAELYPVACRRDGRTLNWRFADYPERGQYHLFYFYLGRRMVGYAVLRFRCRDGLRTGFIVDYFCAPQDVIWVFSRCLTFFSRRRVAAVYALCTCPKGAHWLRWLGFVRRRSGCRLMFKANVSDPAVLELLRNPDSWFVTAGDSDIDRP